MQKTIRVVAAIIHQNDHVFATQRGYGDYKDWWEFPGGKIEENETPEEAIVREIYEELNTEIIVDGFLTTVEYDYPQFHLLMDCFWCSIKEGHLQLVEHEAAKWLPLKNLRQVRWLPADILVVEEIEKSINLQGDIEKTEGFLKKETIERIRNFTEERDWDQYHSPVNLAKSISIEAGELLECFQWNDLVYDIEHVKEELADVLVYCLNLLDKLELNADEIVNMKMDKNEEKYPVEKARGSAVNYTEL